MLTQTHKDPTVDRQSILLARAVRLYRFLAEGAILPSMAQTLNKLAL